MTITNPYEPVPSISPSPTQPPEQTYPLVRFTFSPQYPRAGETITFDCSSSYDRDGISRCEWNFYGQGRHVSDNYGLYHRHVFDAAGFYPFVVTVYDSQGYASQAAGSVTVREWQYPTPSPTPIPTHTPMPTPTPTPAPAKADLIAMDVYPETTAVSRYSPTYVAVIKNAGNSAGQRPIQADIYIDGILSFGCSSSAAVPDPGNSISVKCTGQPLYSGLHKATLVVDSWDVYDERNEADNSITRNFRVWAPSLSGNE